MTITTDRPTTAANPRDLVSPELLDTLARRTAAAHQMPADLAVRVIAATLTMLGAMVDNPGVKFYPPKVIDYGWHTFILHTREYIAFCDRLAGHYLHHRPADGATDGGANIRSTAAFLRDHGYPVDEELWAMIRATNCSNACDGCDNSTT